MQLDAALQSYLLHCEDTDQASLTVLFKTTSPGSAAQYHSLREHYVHHNILFVEEGDFQRDVLSILTEATVNRWPFSYLSRLARRTSKLNFLFRRWWQSATRSKYVLFLVDDNIFVSNFSLLAACQALQQHKDALGFSLRLGKNTTYSYTRDMPQALPNFSEIGGGMLKYNWTTAEQNFAYPLEVSSSVYRLADLAALYETSYTMPNSLESRLSSSAKAFSNKKPHLLCYEQSVAFCNPVNKVQTDYANRAGEQMDYSPASLSQKFDSGLRIDVSAYDGFVPNACHQEVELAFIQAPADGKHSPR